MYLDTAILGQATVRKLQDSATDAVLQIGSDRLTRSDLARVGCYNFVAARILSRILHTELAVKHLRQVYEQVPPSALALPGLGAISLAVLGAAFEVKGIGGAHPLESYVKKHAERVTTWGTLKHRELQEVQEERRARRRTVARRTVATGIAAGSARD